MERLKSLVQQVELNDADLAERKSLLDFTPTHETVLAGFRGKALALADPLVNEFYKHQLDEPEIRAIIGDRDTFLRLSGAMRAYLLRMFDGKYDLGYANSRLRVGQVHARIGVQPRLYIASLHHLENLILDRVIGDNPTGRVALRKLFLLDLEFAFDAYVQGLMSHADLARKRLQRYSESLEEIVANRTEAVTRQSQLDPLSGLRTRAGFDETLQREWEVARSTDCALSLLFFDIDHFKSLNDTQGHLAGDQAIQAVGRVILASLRETDIAFRVGGDEFCLILPGTSADGAKSLAKRIQVGSQSKQGAGVKLSSGIASLSEMDPDSGPRDLYDLADRNLYASRADRKPRLMSLG